MITVLDTLRQIQVGSAPVIYFSRYRVDRVDNGGARRVAQILEALEGHELEFVSSLVKPSQSENPDVSGTSNLVQKIGKTVARLRYREYSAEFANWIFFSRRMARRWVRALEKRDNIRLIIVDDPIFFAPLVRALHGRNIPIIAHCHNLETLSRAQVKENHQQRLLLDELELLKLCNASVTISREETFLLRNLGLHTVYFPYFPSPSIENRLRDVRRVRQSSTKADFLLLGSVGNPPTRRGMQQIIAIWGDINHSIGDDRLIVAGFGTGNLCAECGDAGIELVGAVTDAELDKILHQVKAAIVYQENGAGALTRITELLLAGVPVVANSHAARSYYHIPGIIEFAAVGDLPAILRNHSLEPDKVSFPQRPDGSQLETLVDGLQRGR